MYIGRLNDRLSAIEWRLTNSQGGEVQLKEAGDPFHGERLSVDWKDLVPSGLNLQVCITGNIWLNRIALRFGAKSEPTCVSLYTADKQKQLDCYHGETGKAISVKEIPLAVEHYGSRFVIVIDTDLSDVILESVELYGADLSDMTIEGEGTSSDGEKYLYPTPRRVQWGEGTFPICSFDTVNADCEDGNAAIAILQEKLHEAVGVIVARATTGKIRLCRDREIPENGYRLTVAYDQIQINAADLRGFVQGVETLVKLIDGDTVPACQIEDDPFCAFRGVHLFLPAPDQMDFAKRLIKYLLSPMGYNHIIMEIAGAMRFESHPEINEAFLEANRRSQAGQWPAFPHGSVGGRQVVEKDDIRDLCDYARTFGIEIIPEIQSLGHVQFITQAHPEIAERPENAPVYEATDERLADVPPNAFYAHCYCPSNPASYEILFDLIDEILEVFRPKTYVHMGHDEVYQIGVCPICRQRDPAELFAEDVICIHDYLAEKGLKMMIWSDMLQPVTKYKTPPAISMIPQDIVMLDFIWYFHLNRDIEDNLLSHGFDVIAGNMYSSHYPRYESRIRKEGMRGAQVSAWVPTEEEALVREGKLYDFLYSAQMMWSDTYTHHARYSYDGIISLLIPSLRDQLRGVRSPSLGEHREKLLCDQGRLDPTSSTYGLSLTVNDTFDSLLIEHTAARLRHRIPWIELETIGNYAVTYEDGEELMIPVTYAGNISYYGRRHHQPFTHPYYRHNGYTTSWETDGIEEQTEERSPLTYYRFEWINPRPHVKIRSLIYRPACGEAGDVFVRRVIGICQ